MSKIPTGEGEARVDRLDAHDQVERPDGSVNAHLIPDARPNPPTAVAQSAVTEAYWVLQRAVRVYVDRQLGDDPTYQALVRCIQACESAVLTCARSASDRRS